MNSVVLLVCIALMILLVGLLKILERDVEKKWYERTAEERLRRIKRDAPEILHTIVKNEADPMTDRKHNFDVDCAKRQLYCFDDGDCATLCRTNNGLINYVCNKSTNTCRPFTENADVATVSAEEESEAGGAFQCGHPLVKYVSVLNALLPNYKYKKCKSIRPDLVGDEGVKADGVCWGFKSDLNVDTFSCSCEEGLIATFFTNYLPQVPRCVPPHLIVQSLD